MTLKQIPLAVALALGFGTMASGCAEDTPPAPTAGGDASAHVTAIDSLATARHETWTPDAALLEGMSRVRAAVVGLEAQPPPEQAVVVTRAAEIDAAIQYMFANCKLDPKPDAALHGILAQLIAGTNALQANPADPSAVADMRAALENYERLFADPNSDRGT